MLLYIPLPSLLLLLHGLPKLAFLPPDVVSIIITSSFVNIKVDRSKGLCLFKSLNASIYLCCTCTAKPLLEDTPRPSIMDTLNPKYNPHNVK